MTTAREIVMRVIPERAAAERGQKEKETEKEEKVNRMDLTSTNERNDFTCTDNGVRARINSHCRNQRAQDKGQGSCVARTENQNRN
jgi:hypothetical protein